jgi:ADP-ribose pyrophosphatase YjhB (NUDIX family)
VEIFDSEFMGQKYKIFYRRHHFVFSENELGQQVDLVVHRIDKSLVKALLTYLKGQKGTRVIVFTEDNAFELFSNCFKTIFAAGGAVFNTDGSLLLMKRKGVWDLPKGKLEKGESIVNAAVREVEEECHVFDIEVEQKIGLTYHLYFENKWLLKETHWYQMKSKDWQHAKPQVEEDIEEISWVKREDIDVDSLDTYLNIKHVIKQL